MQITLVQDATALEHLCERIAGSRWIALDTEFTRERTYYARLGLVQLATDDVVACVDPLRLDLAPLLDVLYDRNILKVLHAGRQDLEVLHDLRGAVPQPIFDTQIAAALLGYPDQIGYAALVESITQVKLPKAHTRANWEARPLTPEQLRYAHDDVFYLRDVYRALAVRLEDCARARWLAEECNALADPALYRNDPEAAYTRLPGHALPASAQPLLKALAAWRERTAQSRDRPRAWVATDAALLEIARAAPRNRDALLQLPQVTAAVVHAHGAELLRVVQAASGAPAERVWPAPLPPSAAEQDLARRLVARVKAVAEARRINPSIVATRRAVAALIADRAGPLARGWRRELVGAELLALIDAAAPQEPAGNST